MDTRNDLSVIIANLQKLQSAGYLVALDDFGVEHSNLSRLTSLPIDIVKIDKSLVQPMEHRAQEASAINAIANLAYDLDMTIVAEGVENENTERLLLENGIYLHQGYHRAKPMPINGALAAYYSASASSKLTA